MEWWCTFGSGGLALVGETSAGNGYDDGGQQGSCRVYVRLLMQTKGARGGKGGNMASWNKWKWCMRRSGGAAGNAVVGDSNITWTTLGDVRGNRV